MVIKQRYFFSKITSKRLYKLITIALKRWEKRYICRNLLLELVNAVDESAVATFSDRKLKYDPKDFRTEAATNSIKKRIKSKPGLDQDELKLAIEFIRILNEKELKLDIESECLEENIDLICILMAKTIWDVTLEWYEVVRGHLEIFKEFIISQAIKGKVAFILFFGQYYGDRNLLLHLMQQNFGKRVQNLTCNILALGCFNDENSLHKARHAFLNPLNNIKDFKSGTNEFVFQWKCRTTDNLQTKYPYAPLLRVLLRGEVNATPLWTFAITKHLFNCIGYAKSPIRYHFVSRFVIDFLKVFNLNDVAHCHLILELCVALIAGTDENCFDLQNLGSRYTPPGSSTIVYSLLNLLSWLASCRFITVQQKTLEFLEKLSAPSKKTNYGLLREIYELIKNIKSEENEALISKILKRGEKYHQICFMDVPNLVDDINRNEMMQSALKIPSIEIPKENLNPVAHDSKSSFNMRKNYATGVSENESVQSLMLRQESFDLQKSTIGETKSIQDSAPTADKSVEFEYDQKSQWFDNTQSKLSKTMHQASEKSKLVTKFNDLLEETSAVASAEYTQSNERSTDFDQFSKSHILSYDHSLDRSAIPTDLPTAESSRIDLSILD